MVFLIISVSSHLGQDLIKYLDFNYTNTIITCSFDKQVMTTDKIIKLTKNIDGFDAQLVIYQNFPSIFLAVAIASYTTGCLRY